MTNDDNTNGMKDPGDGNNLSGVETQSSIWIDDRGIHLGFWDVPVGTTEILEVGIKEARFIITFDSHALDKLIQQAMHANHAALDYGLPWRRNAVGAPAPFVPAFRHDKAGIPVEPSEPVQAQPEDAEGGFKSPEGFDPEAWNRKLDLD